MKVIVLFTCCSAPTNIGHTCPMATGYSSINYVMPEVCRMDLTT